MLNPTNKYCGKCKNYQPLDNFYKQMSRGKTLVKSYCKQCTKEASRLWHFNNRDKSISKCKKFNSENRDLIRIKTKLTAEQAREKHLKSTYGITTLDFNKLLEQQNYGCAICKVTVYSSSIKQLYVDHCHKTNKVRGLLCIYCNTLLGYAKEDINNLKASIEYLYAHKNET